MTNPMTSKITEALLKNDSYKITIDAITLSHSVWDEPFRFSRSFVNGGSFQYAGDTYRYLPMLLVRAGQDGNLGQSWKITLQDLNTEVQAAEDAIPIGNDEKPVLEIRTFEFDKRTGAVDLLEGPYIVKVDEINYDATGASIEAYADRININGTGVRMVPDRFATLRPLMR